MIATSRTASNTAHHKTNLRPTNAKIQGHQAALAKWEEKGDTQKVQAYTLSLNTLVNEKSQHEELKAILLAVINEANAKKEEIQKKISHHGALRRTLKA